MVAPTEPHSRRPSNPEAVLPDFTENVRPLIRTISLCGYCFAPAVLVVDFRMDDLPLRGQITNPGN